ncbi:TPA: hypothetical protein HA361_00405 [Candidatus Woesearchaeota archaeon]|nr:hypothetical protein [Candidatus Woesearchaeota archaeon]HII68893.1 hypothetical protein [Candidatus Woesearchaeota archaeon]
MAMVMKYAKTLSIVVLSLLFVLPIAIAAGEFSVQVEPVKSKIDTKGEAVFDVVITNLALKGQKQFRLYTLSYPSWDIATDPLENPIILSVQPGTEVSRRIYVKSLDVKQIGHYVVDLNVRDVATDERITVNMDISVVSKEGTVGQYVPTVIADVDMPEEIDPRTELPITVHLSNQNILDYPNITVILKSDAFERSITTSLDPDEQKEVSLKTGLDPLLPPGEERIDLSLVVGNKVITGPLTGILRVLPYAEIRVVEKKESAFIKSKTYEFATNIPQYDEQIKIPIEGFANLFTNAVPKAKVATDGKSKYLVFTPSLESGNMRIRTTTNYLPLVFIIALAILAALLYSVYRSPISAVKSAGSVEKKGGGLTRMKVILVLKNRSNKAVEKIVVHEQVPNMVEVDAEVSLGTLPPTKILRHQARGSIIQWEIGNLDPSEERVLEYRIRSTLSIIGDFTILPSAIRYSLNKKERVTHSNSVVA